MAAGEYLDIDTCILFAVEDLLETKLRAEIATDDALYLRYIEVGQLQVDFSLDKYHVAIGLDWPSDAWSAGDGWAQLEAVPLGLQVSDRRPEVEMMGQQQWQAKIALRSRIVMRNVLIDGQTTKVTRAMGFGYLSTWISRLQSALWSNPTLDGITNSNFKESIIGGNWAIIQKVRRNLAGEDGEVILAADMLLAYAVFKGENPWI